MSRTVLLLQQLHYLPQESLPLVKALNCCLYESCRERSQKSESVFLDRHSSYCGSPTHHSDIGLLLKLWQFTCLEFELVLESGKLKMFLLLHDTTVTRARTLSCSS